MATGSKSARRTPADGDAFLTSQRKRTSPGRSRAARKSRTGAATARRRSSREEGTTALASASSFRLLATIWSRIVLIASPARSLELPPCVPVRRTYHDCRNRTIHWPASREMPTIVNDFLAWCMALLVYVGVAVAAWVDLRRLLPP